MDNLQCYCTLTSRHISPSCSECSTVHTVSLMKAEWWTVGGIYEDINMHFEKYWSLCNLKVDLKMLYNTRKYPD